MSSDVGWHIRNKPWPMRVHGSMLLYVHRNRKAHQDGEPWTATSTFTQLLNSDFHWHSFPLPLNAAGISVTLFRDVPLPFRYAGICVTLTHFSLSVKRCWYMCHTINWNGFPFQLNAAGICVTLFRDVLFPFRSSLLVCVRLFTGTPSPFRLIVLYASQIHWHTSRFSLIVLYASQIHWHTSRFSLIVAGMYHDIH